jgi:hypothetical protein
MLGGEACKRKMYDLPANGIIGDLGAAVPITNVYLLNKALPHRPKFLYNTTLARSESASLALISSVPDEPLRKL